MNTKKLISSRTGIAIVVALAACSAILVWRVSTLAGLAPAREPMTAGQTEDKKAWYVVYRQSRVISRGEKDGAEDDVVEHRFVRQPLDGGVAETIDTVTTDNQLGYGEPWMTVNGGRELLFYRRRASADDILRIDVMSRPVDGQDGEWKYALPSPDGSTIALLPTANHDLVELRLADGSVRTVGTAGLVSGGYLGPDAWSPDGAKLYLRAYFDGGGVISGLWVMDVATGDLVEIKAVRQLGLTEYAVLPEIGSVIGCDVDRECMDECGGSQATAVYSVDPATGETKEIVKSVENAFYNIQPAPDGRRVAFGLGSGGQETSGVWLMDVGGDFPEAPILSGRARGWTPDSLFLIVERDNEIQTVRLKDMTIASLAERRGQYDDPDYLGLEYVGLARD